MPSVRSTSVATDSPSVAGSVSTLWLEFLRGGSIRHRDAGGVATRSLEAGADGPAVIMLHGTWGHAEAYIRNVVPVAEAGFRTYALDMIGHGFTRHRRGCRYTISDYVGHLFDFLDSIGVERAHVVGESLGGWVAMRAALQDPGRVASVTNVVGGGLRPIPATAEEHRGWSALEQRSREALDSPTVDTWRKRMEWLVLDPAMMTDELVRVRAEINSSPESREASARVFESVYDMLREKVPGVLSAAELKKITVPVFYLWTDHNPTTPASVAAEAHRVTPGSSFHVMYGCAHWPQYERPAAFNDLVTRFLRDTDPRHE